MFDDISNFKLAPNKKMFISFAKRIDVKNALVTAPATASAIASVTPVTQTSVTPVTQTSVTPVTQTSVTPVTQTSVTPVTQTSVTPVTQTSKIGRPKGKINGFTLELYDYIKINDGKNTTEISQHFSKKTDYIRPYLYRLKSYGLVVKNDDKWYLIKEYQKTEIKSYDDIEKENIQLKNKIAELEEVIKNIKK